VAWHSLFERDSSLLSYPKRHDLCAEDPMNTVPQLGTLQQDSDGSETQWLGTPSQIEWAEKIRLQVSAEFDRVAETLEAVALRQSGHDRLDTRARPAKNTYQVSSVLRWQSAGRSYEDVSFVILVDRCDVIRSQPVFGGEAVQ
jgi:hypothetical protein